MKFIQPFISAILFVLLWQAIAGYIGTRLLFPGPADVFRGLMELSITGELFFHVGASAQRIGVGLLVGVPIGVVVGCAMGASRDINAVFDPYLRMANSTPAIALIPFALLWFGVTETARYSLVIYAVVLVVSLSSRQGVQQVPRLLRKSANTLGVSGTGEFFRVVIPASFPSIIAGIRTATGLGVMVVVAAEMLGASSGLGYLIMLGRTNYDPTLIFIGILGLGLLSVTLDRGSEFIIERWMPRWSVSRRLR